MQIPYLKEQNGKKILMVGEKPFVMLAGEVHNSNSSSAEYMEQVWDKAEALGMNALLLPVTWEMVEPQEGCFDFAIVDALIAQARGRGCKIAFLWFGAWKNAQCYYAPEWVKTNLDKYHRAQMEKGCNFINLKSFYGMPYSTLSYMCEATREADAKAFAALMAHIREVDEKENTVIAVQVENETGVMEHAREHSDEADAAFASEAPADFVKYMKSCSGTMVPSVREAVESGKASGTWEEVFGAAAEEIFSAYHISSYVNYVAEAGKKEYALPMTANCWLDKGEEAGKYPSGGPVRKMMEVWRYCAPAIDILAPDIYIPDFCGVCDQYTELGNPLFIPESAVHSYAGMRMVYAVGHYHALCYAPFGFEDIGEPFSATQMYLFGADVTDPALQTPQSVEEYRYFCDALRGMMPILTTNYGTDGLQATSSERPDTTELLFGKVGFKTIANMPHRPVRNGVCLIVRESEDTFYVLVKGMMVSPFSLDAERPHMDILVLEDGKFENGTWKACRRLNGDEVAVMDYDEPTLLKVKVFAYR